MVERYQGRQSDEMRPLKITPGVLAHADGSVEISCGKTRVICAANIEDSAPLHAKERGLGWLSAEYAMLPAATHTRSIRERNRGKPSGRTQEIQRLIGRSLRSIVDLKSLDGHTAWIDCDVLDADGGTRTTAITGAYVALILALKKWQKKKAWPTLPILEAVAAVSVGLVGGHVLLDLEYTEDSQAEVDMNLVMTASGRFVELQATAEGQAFTEEQLQALKDMGSKGISQCFDLQASCLKERQ